MQSMEIKTNEDSNTTTDSALEVGKNIDSSLHCNMCFPNSISIQKFLCIDSGEQQPLTTHCPSPDASHSPPPAARSTLPATSHEGRRVMRCGNTVRAAEAGSRCLVHRSFGNSQHSRSHPGRCTMCPRVALSSRERRGFSVNILPPRF